jgi:hypothetical protein
VLVRLSRHERLSRYDADTEVDQPPAGNGFHIALAGRRILVLFLMVAAVTVTSDPIQILGSAGRSPYPARLGGLVRRVHRRAGNWFVLGPLRSSRREVPVRLGARVLGLLPAAMVKFHPGSGSPSSPPPPLG